MILALIFSAFIVQAQDFTFAEKSAVREPGTSYRAYIPKRWQSTLARGTAYDEAVRYGDAQLPEIVKWDSLPEMEERFARFRDLRFAIESSRPDFLRRSTWLYPDDGCFARAQLANIHLSEWNVPVPQKVFAFGDLRVYTENGLTGLVTWWYHVAPIVEVEGEKYVLDPAIDPRRPMKLSDWVATISDTPADVNIAICSSGAYIPFDSCDREIDTKDVQAETDQVNLLDDEWYRLEHLQRDPLQELGEFPPWL